MAAEGTAEMLSRDEIIREEQRGERRDDAVVVSSWFMFMGLWAGVIGGDWRGQIVSFLDSNSFLDISSWNLFHQQQLVFMIHEKNLRSSLTSQFDEVEHFTSSFCIHRRPLVER